MGLIKKYEAERMTEGKEIEARGIEERKEFLSKYPIVDIQKLTIEQYVLGDGSLVIGYVIDCVILQVWVILVQVLLGYIPPKRRVHKYF